jgi:hypothetical protein
VGLDLVERWFALTHQPGQSVAAPLRRQASGASDHSLIAQWNDNAKPFRWIKTVARIKRSIRNAELIDGTEH